MNNQSSHPRLISLLHDRLGLPRRAMTLLIVVIVVLFLSSMIGWMICLLIRQIISFAAESALGGYLKAQLLLSCSFFLIRKFAEPKIVGSQTGLHPLNALMSSYIGMKITGIWGAICGPVVVMVIISVYHSGIFNYTTLDLKDVARDISERLSHS